MTPEGKALKEQYQRETKAQWKGKPLAGDVRADITLYFGTKRGRLGQLPQALDALSGIAYADDRQIKRATVALAYDKARPRIEIAISEIA